MRLSLSVVVLGCHYTDNVLTCCFFLLDEGYDTLCHTCQRLRAVPRPVCVEKQNTTSCNSFKKLDSGRSLVGKKRPNLNTFGFRGAESKLRAVQAGKAHKNKAHPSWCLQPSVFVSYSSPGPCQEELGLPRQVSRCGGRPCRGRAARPLPVRRLLRQAGGQTHRGSPPPLRSRRSSAGVGGSRTLPPRSPPCRARWGAPPPLLPSPGSLGGQPAPPAMELSLRLLLASCLSLGAAGEFDRR